MHVRPQRRRAAAQHANAAAQTLAQLGEDQAVPKGRGRLAAVQGRFLRTRRGREKKRVRSVGTQTGSEKQILWQNPESQHEDKHKKSSKHESRQKRSGEDLGGVGHLKELALHKAAGRQLLRHLRRS